LSAYRSERKPRRRNGSRLCCTMSMLIYCGSAIPGSSGGDTRALLDFPQQQSSPTRHLQ
jgi:hypothetical protein